MPTRSTRPTFSSTSSEQGFTLLELMVALALAAVISLLISVVGTQAQELYRATTAKVEVYQKFRYALSDMQEQMEKWVPTTSLEFFVDKAAERNEQWDEGEEIGMDTDPDNMSGGRSGYYDEGAHIIERQYLRLIGDFEEKHDNFKVYFKAPTNVDGQILMTNIEYYLAMPNPERENEDDPALVPIPQEVDDNRNFVLMKTVRFINIDDSDFFKNEFEVEKVDTELCRNVTDLRFEYYYDSPFDGSAGGWYTPKKEQEQFGTKAETDFTAVPSASQGLGLMKEFMYGGFRDFGNRSRATAQRAERNYDRAQYVPVNFSVGRGTAIKFSQLGHGDSIYIWSNVGGGGEFGSGNYTVFRNDSGRLEFKQRIDSSSWESPTVGNLRYRAAYVPSAIRIKLRVLNDKGEEPRYLQVVVHPFRKKT